MKLFQDLWKYVNKKRPTVPRAGYNTTDEDLYGPYDYNERAREQINDAFE